MTERDVIIPAAYVFIEKGEETLLLLRENTGYCDGMFSLVAGHVDAGESFREAMVREAYEEAGIVVAIDDLRIVHVQNMSGGADEHERVHIYFSVSKWDGEITNMEPQKCGGLVWYPRHALPTNLAPEVAAAFDAIAAGEIYSEYGWEDEQSV